MKARHVLMATAVAAALVFTVAAPVGAIGLPNSGHLNYDVARVHLTAGGLEQCDEFNAAGATIQFGFIAGDLLMIPLGQRPGEWTDADPFIQVFWCNDDYYSFAAQSGGLFDDVAPEDRTIDLYDSAHLSFTRELLQDGTPTGVTMSVNLTWEATGRPATRNWSDVGHRVSERVAPAQVTGTVTITGWAGPWGDSLTFDADNTAEEGTELAHVSEVWMWDGSKDVSSAVGANLGLGGLWPCAGEDDAGATLSFGLFEHNGRAPLTMGDSYKGTDIDLNLEIFGCNGDYWQFVGHSLDLLGVVDLSGESITLHSAQLVLAGLPMYDDSFELSSVTVDFDLTWTAVGTPRLTATRDAGSIQVFHEADAVATGTVVFHDLPFSLPGLGSTLVFNPENEGGQFLQASTSITTP